MIRLDQALSLIRKHCRPLETVQVPCTVALGGVLAETAIATCDLPRFDNSAVDGYAVKCGAVSDASNDKPVELKLGGTIQAGDDPSGLDFPTNGTLKVLTGAIVPPAAEAVIMKEYAKQQGDVVLLFRSAKPGENIRRRGEEYRQGQEILPAGTRVTPPVIGVLAGLGFESITIHRKPRVTIVTTGNEIIRPGGTLRPGEIYESNSYALAAALKAFGIEEVETAVARDDLRTMTSILDGALATSHVVITVGGVSVGDYDFVKQALTELGVEQIFWQVRMKPGKPNYFGLRAGGDQRRYVFGIPGNPVSALVSFEQLVRPGLLCLLGTRDMSCLSIPAVMDCDMPRRPGRREFVRAVARREVDKLVVKPLAGQGSHMLGGLARANCLIDVPEDCKRLERGQAVLIQWLNSEQ